MISEGPKNFINIHFPRYTPATPPPFRVVFLCMYEKEYRIVSLNGLSRELRIPRNWLKTEADTGRIPCLRVGRKRLFNLAAVQRALAERAAQIETERQSDDRSN